MKCKTVAMVIVLVSVLLAYSIMTVAHAIPSKFPHPDNVPQTVHWWRDVDENGFFDPTVDAHNHRDAEGFDNDPVYDAFGVWDDVEFRVDRIGSFDRGHGFINEWATWDFIPKYWFDPADNWPTQVRRLIITAFHEYDRIGPDIPHPLHKVGIAFRIIGDEKKAEIRLHWHDLGAPPGGNLGQTELAPAAPGEEYWNRPNGAPVTITFNNNSAINWYYGPQATTPDSSYHFFSTALHEIGHAVGLDEQYDNDDVMIYGRRPGRNNTRAGQGPAFDGLDLDTVHGIRDLYMIEPYYQSPPTPPHGPRSDLDFHFYPNEAEAYAALVAGEIDIMAWPLTFAEFEAAECNPNIILAPYQALDMFQFDLNNNDTTMVYPGVKSPTSDPTFRKALAHMVDKDYIVNVICTGLAERIDVPIPALLESWWNQSVIGPNYPYPYNLTMARVLLASIGFEDLEPDGILNYPADWPGRPGRPNMDAIFFYARSEDSRILGAAEHLRDNMLMLGIPVDFRAGPATLCYSPVIQARDYHIYAGGWLLERFPLHLFQLYHSMFWYSQELNYVVPPCQYPELDEALENFWYAGNIEEAREWAKNAQSIFVENAISIPLWSTKSFMAYSKNLAGVVNMAGYGLINDYTFLNAYKAYNPWLEPIKVGLIGQPLIPYTFGVESLPGGFIGIPPPIVWKSSIWSFDWSGRFLLERITEPLLSLAPYDISVDQPWLAQDWDVGTWFDFETNETKTSITFWLRKDAGINTGDLPLDLLLYDVHHIVHLDNYTIRVYLDIPSSVWALYLIGEMPLLYHPVISMYEVSSFMPGPSGYLTLWRNPYFFLETPPLGEIDWRWHWEGTVKPRSGYYKIDILDVVMATASYCHRGDGLYDPKYFPGADIDSSDLGHIGIFDIVTITIKYAKTFGRPP